MTCNLTTKVATSLRILFYMELDHTVNNYVSLLIFTVCVSSVIQKHDF